MQKDNIKLVVKLSKDLYNRIKHAKSVPDLSGTDIVNTILCVSKGSEITGADDFIRVPDRDWIDSKIIFN